MIFTDENNEPILVVDADDFIRSELVCEESKEIEFYCHQPLVIKDSEIDLGSVIKKLKVIVTQMSLYTRTLFYSGMMRISESLLGLIF